VNLPERLPSIMSTFPIYSFTISATVAFVVKKSENTRLKYSPLSVAFFGTIICKLYLKGRGLQKLPFINCKCGAKIQQTAQTVVLYVHFPNLLNG
jgi:hypothetical protein